MRLLIAAPFLLLLVIFALSNRAPVTLGLWPTDLHLAAPLSLVVFAAAAIGVLLGACLVWVNELRQRRRARRAEAAVRRLEAERQALQARMPSAAATAPSVAPSSAVSAAAPAAPPRIAAS